MEVQTLQNRPDTALPPELRMLLSQFLTLNGQRPPDGGSIPISEMEAYHRVYRIGEYMELAEFVDCMMELDGVMLTHHGKEAERREAERREKPKRVKR